MRMLGYMGGQWRKVAKEALDRSMIVVKFLCLLHVTNNYLGSTTLVYGPSMLPTLNLTGDVVLAERLSTRFGKVGLGDIVLVRSPENPRRTITKRILGMEGDTVTFLVDPRDSDRRRTLVDESSGMMIGRAKEKDGLCYLEVPTNLSVSNFKSPLSFLSEFSHANKDQIWLYHRRLGHPSFGVLKLMFPSLFKGVDSVNFHCDVCELTKYRRVPQGHVWIQGDNIYASKDSRHFGPVPYGLIKGKVCCRVWPLDGFGSLGE